MTIEYWTKDQLESEMSDIMDPTNYFKIPTIPFSELPDDWSFDILVEIQDLWIHNDL